MQLVVAAITAVLLMQPAASPTDDLEIVMHERGAAYSEAHARLLARPEQTAAQVTARLADRSVPPADEARLWSLLAAVAPGDVAGTRARLRPLAPPRPAPRARPLFDPRTDARWAERDRALTAGVRATGVLFGVAVVGVILAIVLPPAIDPPPASDTPCIDCYPLGAILVLAVVPPAAIPLTVVAGVRSKHRRPLRAYKASLAGAGFQLRF